MLHRLISGSWLSNRVEFCRVGDRVEISTGTVLEALQRNFGGLPASDFQQVVTAFLDHLRRACGHHKFPDPQPEQFRPTLEVLSASLEETGHNLLEQHATLSDKLARPKLIIDYTGMLYLPPNNLNWPLLAFSASCMLQQYYCQARILLPCSICCHAHLSEPSLAAV